jgi:prolyl-tRNA synthetase
MEQARLIYAGLQEAKIPVLFDDRSERAGVKFKDADLLGFTLQVIIGTETLKKQTIEIKVRRSAQKAVVPEAEALSTIRKFLNG